MCNKSIRIRFVGGSEKILWTIKQRTNTQLTVQLKKCVRGSGAVRIWRLLPGTVRTWATHLGWKCFAGEGCQSQKEHILALMSFFFWMFVKYEELKFHNETKLRLDFM